jgi:hypothetical protein
MTQRAPLRDMLGNPINLGDIIFRPTIRIYERVVEIKPYNPKFGEDRKHGTYQVLTDNLYRPGITGKQWLKEGKNVLKVNMTPEVESALILMDTTLSDFQPKLILDFKS